MDLPVTVIGGYLGAGKTTLVNQLLRGADGVRYAVLVNEFGDLPIDADLIEAEGDGLISISGGCVCCAFGSDLIGALEDMVAMNDRLDHVLIEASGVALPASVATTVSLIHGLRADSVLVLADADQIEANAASPYLADTIDRQLAQADLVILTKSDLVSPKGLERVTTWLRGKAPGTRIVQVTRGEVSAAAILGVLPLPKQGRATGADAHGLFNSVVLAPEGQVDAVAFAKTLAEEPGITRAKGFVRTAEGMALIHVVGHRSDVEPATRDHPVGVVCIGLKADFDGAKVRALLPCTA